MHAMAFIDSKTHPSAIPYYNIFQEEPVPPESGMLTVTSIVALKDKTLEGLLKQIVAKATTGGNLLIVGHGNEDGLYFTIGTPRLGVMLQRNAIVPMRRNLAGTDSDGDTATTLLTSVKHWQSLKDQIKALQQLSLNRVDLRACNTGKKLETLFDLLAFFNCSIITAPTEYDAFGPIKLGKFTNDAAYWKNWLKTHPKAIVEGDPPARFALQTRIGPTEVQMDALAESEEAAKAWTRKHLSPSAHTKLPTFYHGFTNLQTIVLAGDPGFRKLITEARKGDEPAQGPVDPRKSSLP